VTGIPLTALSGAFLGALSLFWMRDPDARTPDLHPSDPGAPLAVETILTRRLASRLATPIFIVDPQGALLYHNDAASSLLGHPLAGAPGRAGGDEPYRSFRAFGPGGARLRAEEHPMAIACSLGHPVHQLGSIRGSDGRERNVAITAVPLIGQSDRLAGAFGLVWETSTR